MGNCLLGGMGDGRSVIRVATSKGGVMEFHGPVTVESITDEFPGHGIFRDHGLFWKPLPHADVLLAGESYRLLPLSDAAGRSRVGGHVRSSSAPTCGSGAAPYRMSFDRRVAGGESGGGKAPAEAGGGFWRVKLVISPEQLVEILAEDGRTEELIESVRTVAKCGSGAGGGVWGGFSDQWSLVSSKNGALSAKDGSLSDF